MVISNVGINDMPSGWRLKNDENKRIYTCWSDMIRRCYSEKSLKTLFIKFVTFNLKFSAISLPFSVKLKLNFL